ncbi:uncharacterized protein LOC123898251 [Trifolium pratense]|uniref:uncharacterized protein LOC123898251 n=1 Tax=Trifolium pratense TaxID=57577 RepID=UPI001E694F37|nr:uncharacterized protein LOC123898251 [Trifolium pratense]
MATAAFASSPQIATFLSKSSSSFHFHTPFCPLSLPTTPSFSPIITTSTKSLLFQRKSKLLWPNPVAAAAAAAVEDAAVDATDQLVSTTSDDGVSVVVSVLFFVAFVGLSVITVGVIYLAVTDFLTKREKEKFEKEEAAKNKNKKKTTKKEKNKLKFVRAGRKAADRKNIQDRDDD